jgi:carboxyl-terminal processing protease
LGHSSPVHFLPLFRSSVLLFLPAFPRLRESPIPTSPYHRTVIASTLISSLALFAAAFGTGAQNGKSVDFKAMWNRVETAISSRYYARSTRKEEMEKLFDKYEPKASEARSKEEFSAAINAMIKDFGDSHFDFLTTEDQGFYTFKSLMDQNIPDSPHIGAWFKKGADGYTVQMVLNGMPAEGADIRKGDLIVSVNGKPFAPITPLSDLIGKRATLKVKRKGQMLDKSLDVSSSKGMNLFLEATRNSVKVIEHEGKKIGYIHLWTMANDDFRNALSNAVYGRLKDTDGFILDIRDGFGGRPEGFGDPFFRPEANLEWKFGSASGMKQLFGYQRPLVVLINEGSRSAKEVFSHIIKKSKRGTLVGTTTAGHVLGTSPMALDDWAMLEIPMVDVIADGVRLEGKGVSPDIEVRPEFDEAGKDLHLAKGLEVVVRQIGERKAITSGPF